MTTPNTSDFATFSKGVDFGKAAGLGEGHAVYSEFRWETYRKPNLRRADIEHVPAQGIARVLVPRPDPGRFEPPEVVSADEKAIANFDIFTDAHDEALLDADRADDIVAKRVKGFVVDRILKITLGAAEPREGLLRRDTVAFGGVDDVVT